MEPLTITLTSLAVVSLGYEAQEGAVHRVLVHSLLGDAPAPLTAQT